MDEVNQLVATGRQLLYETPGLTEVEFRERMLERFRANDQGLQKDTANMIASPGFGQIDGLFAIVALPWTVFRWLGWRARLGRHRADMDAAVRQLRQEGHFKANP